jgi:predicted nucleic-acid-binding Zn-ribbon protein
MDPNTRRFEDDAPQDAGDAAFSFAAGSGDQPTVRLSPGDAASAAQGCARCGGALIPAIIGMDVRNGKVVVKRPGTWFGILSGGVSQIDAFACTECGYTEFFATTPQALGDGDGEGQATIRLDPSGGDAATARCAKCGGALTTAEVGMDVRNGKIVFQHPGSWIGSRRASPIDARCCTTCGYTVFYAAKLDAMFADDRVASNPAGGEPRGDLSAGAGSCVQCGGKVQQVTAGMNNRNGQVVVKQPGTFIGKVSRDVSRLRIDSCTECGYTDFYARNPAVLAGKE